MDYNSLNIQIQNYTNRNDAFFISQIPDFINLGINRIYREAKNIGFQKILDGDPRFTENNPLIPRPTDWRQTISLSYLLPGNPPQRKYLLPRSYEFCQTYAPDPIIFGDPYFYADYSLPTAAAGPGSIFISPTPTVAYQYELIYLCLPLFNPQNSRNFLTDRYPNLLLYACLKETIPFLKDDERAALFDGLYNTELKDIIGDTTSSYSDRVSRRDKT